MAFRQYEIPVDESQQASALTSHSIDMPACDIGDLLIVLIATRSNAGYYAVPDKPRGLWQSHGDREFGYGGWYHAYYIWTRYCDGTEGDAPLEFTTDNGCYTLARFIRIHDWHRHPFDTDHIAVNFPSGSAVTSTPTPPALTPSWGAADTLWIIGGFTGDDDGYPTAYPSGYVDGSYLLAGGGTNASNGFYTAFRENNTATETPGAVTLNENERVFGFTIALRPSVSHTLTAPSYLVKNLDDGTVYYSSDITTERDVYSLTKIFTAAVVRDNKIQSELQAEARTIVTDDLTGGSGNNLSAGDELKLEALLIDALLPSSNTAATALAAQIGGEIYGGTPTHAQSLDQFMTELDNLGTTLGLDGPTGGFLSAAGWPSVNSLTCEDIYKGLGDIYQDTVVTDIWSMPEATVVIDNGANVAVDHTMTQAALLHNVNTGRALGGKTGGNDSPASYSIALVWTAPSGDRVAIIALDTNTSDNRFQDARQLIKQLKTDYPALLSAGTVSADMQPLYNIAELTNADLQSLWQILNPVSSDSQARWNIAQLVNADSQHLWDIASLVSADSQLPWNIKQLAASDSQLLWDIISLSAVSADLQALYRINNTVSADAQLLYVIRELITADAQLLWDILETGIVSADLSAPYNIAELVHADGNLPWQILGVAAADAQLPWQILGTVAADAELLYQLLNLAGADLAATWNIEELASADLTMRWHILGDAVTRILTEESGNRLIRIAQAANLIRINQTVTLVRVDDQPTDT